MKFNIVTVSRILVGSLFIISGLIKANDPLGFSYKLEEYFAPDVLNWTVFQGAEVAMAAIISIGEVVIGVALLAGEKIKLTSWLLLLMIIFFTFLTGYTAIGNWFFEHPDASLTKTFEGVFGFTASEIHYFKDCGCFGDAIPFTPWDSFLKDLVLLIFTTIIFVNRNRIETNTVKDNTYAFVIALLLITFFTTFVMGWWFPVYFTAGLLLINWLIKRIFQNKAAWIMAGFTFVYALTLPVYALTYLPQKDFRPFAVGKNISEGMEIPEGKEPPVYGVDYFMRDTITGKDTVVNSVEYLEKKVWENKRLKIVETGETYLIKDGYIPPIHDFVLETPDSGEDMTEWVLTQPWVLLVVTYDITKADEDALSELTVLGNEAIALGIEPVGVSSNTQEETDEVIFKYNLPFNFLVCDGTTLKTVIRSNPGIVLLNYGTVVAKWPYRKMPSGEELQKIITKDQP